MLTRIVHERPGDPGRATSSRPRRAWAPSARSTTSLSSRPSPRSGTARYTGDLFLNLSPRALVLNEFMPTVRKLLSDYNMEPSKMVFEITERDTVKGLDIIEQHIQDLKAEGLPLRHRRLRRGLFLVPVYQEVQRRLPEGRRRFHQEHERHEHHRKGHRIEHRRAVPEAGHQDHRRVRRDRGHPEPGGLAGIDYAQGYYIRRPSPNWCEPRNQTDRCLPCSSNIKRPPCNFPLPSVFSHGILSPVLSASSLVSGASRGPA